MFSHSRNHDRHEFDVKLKKIQTRYNCLEEVELAERVEQLFEEYLQKNPYDTDMWLKFAIFLHEVPLADVLKAIDCLNIVLKYDQNNIYALLVLAYIEAHDLTLSEDLFQKLLSFQEITDQKLASMIELAKSWYYMRKNQNEYEKSLKKSIKFFGGYRKNYTSLAEFYIKQGKLSLACFFLKKGLSNVKKIYCIPSHFLELDSIEDFLDERYKGTAIIDVIYKRLKEKLEEIC